MERKERNAEGKTSVLRGFLRQVATGHFVDLTTLGIFFNLLLKNHF
jgi:hypothetical protein